MSLVNKQSKFTFALARLLLYAESLGYQVTLGDAYATTGHIEGSFHYKRLAIDLNLFIDGEYIRDSRGHDRLGVFWKLLGGSWGGDFPNKDFNHYSWGESREDE